MRVSRDYSVAQAAEADDDQVRPMGCVAAVGDIEEHRLANGLRVVMLRDDTSPSVITHMVYLAGAADDSDGQSGTAHLLEHVAAGGTAGHNNLYAEQAFHGSFAKAATSRDATIFRHTLPVGGGHLRWALEVEADRMRNALIVPDRVDTQKMVVLNESRDVEGRVAAVLAQRLFATAYSCHPYRRSVLGLATDVRRATVERLRTFYEAFYHPDNAALVLAGRFDDRAVLDLVGETLGGIPRSPQLPARIRTEEPEQDGERSVTIRSGSATGIAVIGFHVPCGADPDIGSIDLIAKMVDTSAEDPQEGAVASMQETTRFATRVYSLQDPGLALFSARFERFCTPAEALERLRRRLDSVHSATSSPERVEQARAALLSRIDATLNDTQTLARALAEYAAVGDWRLLFLEQEWIGSATRDSLRYSLEKYFAVSNGTVAVFGPCDQRPTSPRPALPASAHLPVDLRKRPRSTGARACAESLSDLDAEVHTLTIRSQFRMAVLSKPARAEAAHILLVLRFGDECRLRGRAIAGEITASMLPRSAIAGGRALTQGQATDLGPRMVAAGAANTLRVQIDTVKRRAADALRLAGQVLRFPAFSPPDFRQTKDIAIQENEATRNQPHRAANIALSRHFLRYSPEDPRNVLTPADREAALRTLELDDIRRFHAHFYGADDGELIVVGDVDAAELMAVAREQFGDWANPSKRVEIRPEYRRTEGTTSVVNAPGGRGVAIAVGALVAAGEYDADFWPLMVGVHALGGHAGSRMFTRLRDREGLTYALHVSLNPDCGNRSLVRALATTSTESAPRLRTSMEEELRACAKGDFAPEEVLAGRLSLLRHREVDRSKRAGLAELLRQQLSRNRGLADAAKLERRIGSISPEEVAGAFRRRFEASTWTVIEARDMTSSPSQHGGEMDVPDQEKHNQ